MALQQPSFPSATPLLARPRGVPAPQAKRQLSNDETEEIGFAFETLDFEKTGKVTQKQLKVALRAMGFPVKKQDVKELLRRQGEEETEQLDFSVFQRAVADKLSERTPHEDMQRAFQLLDVHGQGKIDLPALRKVVKSLGLELQESELQDMIHEFDTDGDGALSELEFMTVMAATED